MAKKILIIDDDDDIRTFLETLFKKEGYETVAASNGVAGLEIMKRENPDLVTLDLQMPQNTGTDFYRKLRRDDKYKNVPIIVISGLPGRHLALPEPFAVFDKPIDKDTLIEKAREALA
ncbi:MAG: response regulator [Candidatus Zixiibacteriota bacterium]|nr:MAG: response regulator [candidate division Zixibacteria bacterium]